MFRVGQGLGSFGMILLFKFELFVVVEVHIFETVLGVLLDGLVVLFGQDRDNVVLLLLLLVDVALVDEFGQATERAGPIVREVRFR